MTGFESIGGAGRPGAGSAPDVSPSVPQALDHSLACAIISVDRQRRITGFTPKASELTGLAAEAVLGQAVSLLPEPLPGLFQEALSEEVSHWERHVLLPSSSGGQFTVRVSALALHAADGAGGGAVLVLHDVTPVRFLDENLRRLDRLASIGTLSASMAHEVKNAMVAIKTFVDLLVRQNQEAALAEIVGKEMRRIDSIVSQMLRFSGPARPAFATLPLHRILEDALTLVQHHLEGRKIRLVRDFQADPDTVRGDLYQLQQAFLNLFLNSLQAMGAHGELRVTTELVEGPELAGPQVRVSVRDTGIGIAPENLKRLFDPFFTTKPDGTGLGLPITRRILEEHHGSIGVTSELNEGTTFTLLLPSASRQP